MGGRELFLAVALLACAGAPCAAQPDGDWRTALQPMDWTMIGRNDGLVLYVKPGDPGSHQVWARYEFGSARQDSTFSYRSMTELDQVNCADASYVNLQQTLYSNNNLSGEPYKIAVDDKPQTGGPGTIGAAVVSMACKA